jgi:hypothetical protein
VYIEYVPAEYIENIFFHQKLMLDLSEITVEAKTTGGDGIRIHLAHGRREVLNETSALLPEAGLKIIKAQLNSPMLWSPETPTLYDLTVELMKNGGVVDTVKEKVGFKDLTIKGNRFYLNGSPYFFKGVCRHDTWGEQGFTLTDEQIETDMQMIKDLGANFVRLVHYPHDVRVVGAADRIGLLVSEEPGLWWSDMQNPEVTGGALEVLKRTILRDRSRVSMAFWFAFNECVFTEEFLKDTEVLVRSLDPYRAVSGANCMDPKMTKELFSKYNWDFYTFHPYGPLPDMVYAGLGADEQRTSIDKMVEGLNDKPLIFSEWGGWFVHDNPALYKRFVREMAAYAGEREDGLHLAGMFYWSWNDIYEINRGAEACTDGILVEGLVDIHRNKRVNYYTQADCFHEFERLQPRFPGEMEIFGLDVEKGLRQTVIDIYAGQDMDANKKAFYFALEKAKDSNGPFRHKKKRHLNKGPVLPYEIRSIGGLNSRLEVREPLIADESPVNVPINIIGSTLCLIGMTVLGEAYPIAGKPGETLAKLTIRYTDGTKHEQELQNGREICTAFMTFGSTRIDAQAGAAKRLFTFSYDKNWESYCMNALCIPISNTQAVQSVEIVSVGGYPVLLYGITVFD